MNMNNVKPFDPSVVYTKVVGGFATTPTKEFDDSFKNLKESFQASTGMDIFRHFDVIITDDTMKNSYKEMLLSDIRDININHDINGNTIGSLDTNPYNESFVARTEALFDNTVFELAKEASTGSMNPLVPLSLAVLKKSWLTCASKDVVNTEVPTAPIVKIPFQRDFIKDDRGNKYYIPDVFYDEKYKDIMDKGRGLPFPDTYLPVANLVSFNLLTHAGGSMAMQDTLNLDFCVKAIKGTSGADTFELTNMNVQIKQGTNGAINEVLTDIPLMNAGVPTGNTIPKLEIIGQVDLYNGTITLMFAPAGLVTDVKFGGHLSNKNNRRSIDLDTERNIIEFQIPDDVKINTGLTVEDVRDYKVLFDMDITTRYIHLIGEVLSQNEDSSVFRFLDDSLARWQGVTTGPFGYDGFVEMGTLSAMPAPTKVYGSATYLNEDFKLNIDRFVQKLKNKLKSPGVMIVVYGHPENITLLNGFTKWVVNPDTRIGGVQIDYSFGIITHNQDRIHVVSSLKVPKDNGLRFVVHSVSPEIITFKHYKYSFNIETNYRNPMNLGIPNIMGTSRYLTAEVLPVQGQIKLTDTAFDLT